MKLFDDLKRCKKYRKDYKIKPSIKFAIDREDYCLSFIPTIVWCRWMYRYPNTDGVIDIWWLNFHILIGRFERVVNRDNFGDIIEE